MEPLWPKLWRAMVLRT
uniref:Uncharacterized protein n=1 Tax=Arundo donax TaxID=35708 RepID=A0A0A9ADQ5_ARUDO